MLFTGIPRALKGRSGGGDTPLPPFTTPRREGGGVQVTHLHPFITSRRESAGDALTPIWYSKKGAQVTSLLPVLLLRRGRGSDNALVPIFSS